MLCAETRFGPAPGLEAAIYDEAVSMRFLMSCFICALLAGCGGPPAGQEEALHQWVADAEAAAEEKDRRGLLNMISENYADNRGNDYERVGQILRAYFLRQQKIVIVSKIDQIVINADTAAEINLTAGMAGTRESFGLDADAYRFNLELEYDDGQWLLIGARWGQLAGELH